jgi:hypothetical protein
MNASNATTAVRLIAKAWMMRITPEVGRQTSGSDGAACGDAPTRVPNVNGWTPLSMTDNTDSYGWQQRKRRQPIIPGPPRICITPIGYRPSERYPGGCALDGLMAV